MGETGGEPHRQAAEAGMVGGGESEACAARQRSEDSRG